MRVAVVSPLRVGLAVLTMAAIAAAVAGGVAAAIAPPQMVAGGACALAVLTAVAVHPPFAAYLVLATTPLLAGLDRDQIVPLLRPSEVVALLVGAGAAGHLLACGLVRVRPRMGFTPGRVDLAILGLAVAGSAVPLAVMTLRDRPIEQLDLLYALQVWKFAGVFWLVRLCIRTPAQVRACLWISMCAAAGVAALALLQVATPPIHAIQTVVSSLTSTFESEEGTFTQLERGTSTLSSSIAVGDVMTFSLAIAGGLLLKRDPRALTIVGLSVLFFLGVVATGQFSAIIALAIGLLAFGWLTGRLGRLVLISAPVALAAGLALRRVIEARLSGFEGGQTLPASWQARLDNVTTYFIPPLEVDYNWLTGVRPLARIEGPRFSGIDYIWIESGYVYLLWTGGIAFLLAFLWYVWVAARAVARRARRVDGPIGAAATASFTALCVTTVLMVLDPHVTLRGSADLSFALLALALVAPAGARAAR